MRNPIAPLLADRIPLFIKEDYPKFHTLIKSFYDWLETDNNFLHVTTGFLESQEANSEIDGYIDTILSDMGWNYSGELAVNKKFIVNTLRDFYLSKGSSNSFVYLFRALFGEEVFISYPRDRVFSASSAAYSKDLWIMVSSNSFGTEAYNEIVSGTSTLWVTVTGIKSKTSLNANKINPIVIDGVQYIGVMVNDIGLGFSPFETVRISSGSASILETIYNCVTLVIESAGKAYSPGDSIEITNASINGKAIVKTVHRGSISRINMINGGTGYAIGDQILADTSTGHSFYALVSSVDENGVIKKIDIHSTGYEYSKIPLVYILSESGSGAELVLESDTIGGIKTIEVIDQFWGIGSPSIATVKSANGSGAIILVNDTKCISNDTATFKNTKGFTEINCVLHDSNYFQTYSYELRSRVSRSRYKSIIDEYTHPSGTICYSVYDNESVIDAPATFPGTITITKVIKFDLDWCNAPFASPLWMDITGYVEIPEVNAHLFTLSNLDRIKFADNFETPISSVLDMKINNQLRKVYFALPADLTQETI